MFDRHAFPRGYAIGISFIPQVLIKYPNHEVVFQ
jgi:hypothetical protein